MKIVKRENYNTTNAWGFGGVIGERILYDNGIVHERGREYYRHSKPLSYSKLLYSFGEELPIVNCSDIKKIIGKSLYKISSENGTVVMAGVDSQPTEKEIKKVFSHYDEGYKVEFIMTVE
jgi:hypothetical protein